ncbi:cytochrome P450 [Nocardia vinacea]|uniref:Cytochrome P450 n=1 Tax=Nocardia vinacea TaxID=96468 RepID=A0ABZ1YWT4_9NOCA|nr:cytochrome P450 [Nocardia vinacea]
MTTKPAMHPLDPDLYLDGLPLELFDQIRRDTPCLRVELNDPRQIDFTWVVTRHADVLTVLRDSSRFTVTQGVTVNKFSMSTAKFGGKPAILTMDRADHKRVRPVLGATFTPKAVKLFSESYGRLARDVVASAVAKGQFDVVEDISIQLPMYAICDLLGIPAQDRDMVREWGDAQASPLDPEFAPSPEYILESINRLWDYAAELAELRRKDPREDIVSHLVPKIGTPELSMEEYLGMVSLLAVAGNETTRNNISHSVQALIDHPEVWDALADADEDLWSTTVDELTRWSSPVIGFRRTATEDLELHGQQIRAGDSVMFLLNAANYDPQAFDRPERFDMRRRPNPHVAFGAGEHFCLGAHLARIETRLVVQELRRQLRSITPAGPVIYARSTHVRGVKRLPVSVELATEGK